MQPHRDHVPVQRGCHPGGVGVPEEYVERRRRLTFDVVVDPVAPHQVRRPQPREHLRQRSAVQVALSGGQRDRDVGGLFVDGGRSEARLALVEHRHHQRQSGEPLTLPRRVEMRSRHRGENPPGAGCLQMRAIRLRDLLDGVQRVQDRLAVGVETPISLFRSGIAPRYREDLDALPQKILDHAPARGDVHDVELVDHRWHHQQRRREDLVGLRGVLDQLEFLTAEDHRTRGDGDVLAQSERVGLHHRRNPWRRFHVVDEVAQPSHRAESTGVDERLPPQRVQHRVVARCEPFG